MNAAWSFSEADLNSKGGRRVRALTDCGGGENCKSQDHKMAIHSLCSCRQKGRGDPPSRNFTVHVLRELGVSEDSPPP